MPNNGMHQTPRRIGVSTEHLGGAVDAERYSQF